eukprot:jgi/Botrbrau1/8744/Bobra.0090s0018.1
MEPYRAWDRTTAAQTLDLGDLDPREERLAKAWRSLVEARGRTLKAGVPRRILRIKAVINTRPTRMQTRNRALKQLHDTMRGLIRIRNY